MVDVQFIYDILGLKLIKIVGNDEIDYNESSIRLHLPKRYQDQLEGISDLSLLNGGLILSFLFPSLYFRKAEKLCDDLV